MSTTLRAEFFLDDGASTWHYHVPGLHINGGGTATREDAQRKCLDAISRALEGDPSPAAGTSCRSAQRWRNRS